MSMLLAALLISANPTVAEQPTTAAVTQPAKPQKERKICHTEGDTTGSHMVKRTCLTQREWDARVQGRTVDEFNSTVGTPH